MVLTVLCPTAHGKEELLRWRVRLEKVMSSMKKLSSTPFLIWVMVITLHAHLSIAAVSNANDSTPLCDGSLQDCLIFHQLDSEFPTITTTMVAKSSLVTPSNVFNPRKPAIRCRIINNGYRFCSNLQAPDRVKINPERCSPYKRTCPR
ncbi:hypothetical protein ACSQ67_023188 [Phaseolus vulgaris]